MNKKPGAIINKLKKTIIKNYFSLIYVVIFMFLFLLSFYYWNFKIIILLKPYILKIFPNAQFDIHSVINLSFEGYQSFFLVYIVIAPIIEEMFFRYLYFNIVDVSKKTVIFNALAFGFSHLNLFRFDIGQAILTSIVGYFLYSKTYYVKKDLRLNIIFHGLWNLIIIYIIPKILLQILTFPGFLFAFVFGISLIMLIFYNKYLNKIQEEKFQKIP